MRELVRLTLVSRGYKVLEAENGESGLRMAESFKKHIDILITDVVMPGMGGRELAQKLLLLRPAISVLYLSGYTEDAVVTRGALGPSNRVPAETLHPSESRQESPRSPSLQIRSAARPRIHGKISLELVSAGRTSPGHHIARQARLPSPRHPQLQLFPRPRVLY